MLLTCIRDSFLFPPLYDTLSIWTMWLQIYYIDWRLTERDLEGSCRYPNVAFCGSAKPWKTCQIAGILDEIQTQYLPNIYLKQHCLDCNEHSSYPGQDYNYTEILLRLLTAPPDQANRMNHIYYLPYPFQLIIHYHRVVQCLTVRVTKSVEK
jgi:hypothetical protein